MPKAFRPSRLHYPPDWDVVREKLTEFSEKLNDVVLTQKRYGDQERKLQQQIARLNFERSAYVFSMYYEQERIGRECYEFCVKQKFVDAALIAKWKRTGSEFLCCVDCLQKSQFGTRCVCRVPRASLQDAVAPCKKCGCSGCATVDKAPSSTTTTSTTSSTTEQ